MRILVISDSHRNTRAIEKIISAQKEASHVFFLGDNEADIEDFDLLYPEKSFHTVAGNCDYCAISPTVGIENINGVKILYTHGHTFGIKGGYGNILQAAKQNGCNIVLCGHTHTAVTLYEDGVYLVNPGSCSSPRDGAPSYAVIDITDKGIMPIIIRN